MNSRRCSGNRCKVYEIEDEELKVGEEGVWFFILMKTCIENDPTPPCNQTKKNVNMTSHLGLLLLEIKICDNPKNLNLVLCYAFYLRIGILLVRFY